MEDHREIWSHDMAVYRPVVSCVLGIILPWLQSVTVHVTPLAVLLQSKLSQFLLSLLCCLWNNMACTKIFFGGVVSLRLALWFRVCCLYLSDTLYPRCFETMLLLLCMQLSQLIPVSTLVPLFFFLFPWNSIELLAGTVV